MLRMFRRNQCCWVCLRPPPPALSRPAGAGPSWTHEKDTYVKSHHSPSRIYIFNVNPGGTFQMYPTFLGFPFASSWCSWTSCKQLVWCGGRSPFCHSEWTGKRRAASAGSSQWQVSSGGFQSIHALGCLAPKIHWTQVMQWKTYLYKFYI